MHACFSPTGLGHAWNLAVQGELAETQAANAELPQKRARTAAAPAAVPVPAGELGRLVLRARQHAGRFQLDIFRNLGSGGHNVSASPLAICEISFTNSIGGTASPFASAAPDPPHR